MTVDELVQEALVRRAKQMAETNRLAYYIADLSDPAETLDGVYAQFKLFRTAPDDYRLPDDYTWAEEVICGFDQDDYEGFLEFARAIVNEFPKKSDARRPVQEVYRKINGWADAGRRRALISTLEYGYQKTHGYLPVGRIKRNYIETILNRWKEERQDGLSALSRYDKASHEERIEFLRDFWRKKSDEAWNGKVPHWRELLQEDSDPTPASDEFEEDESIIEEPEALSERDELQVLTGRAEAMAVAVKTAIDASNNTTAKAVKLAAMLVEMAGLLRDEIHQL